MKKKLEFKIEKYQVSNVDDLKIDETKIEDYLADFFKKYENGPDDFQRTLRSISSSKRDFLNELQNILQAEKEKIGSNFGRFVNLIKFIISISNGIVKQMPLMGGQLIKNNLYKLHWEKFDLDLGDPFKRSDKPEVYAKDHILSVLNNEEKNTI